MFRPSYLASGPPLGGGATSGYIRYFTVIGPFDVTFTSRSDLGRTVKDAADDYIAMRDQNLIINNQVPTRLAVKFRYMMSGLSVVCSNLICLSTVPSYDRLSV